MGTTRVELAWIAGAASDKVPFPSISLWGGGTLYGSTRTNVSLFCLSRSRRGVEIVSNLASLGLTGQNATPL